MRNPYGHGKLEDRPNPHTTHNYRGPLAAVFLGTELRIALVVFAVLSFFLVTISRPCYMGKCYGGNDFVVGVLVEAHGMLLDLLIIGFVVVWLNRRAQQAHESVQYQEEIDSLRGWKDREAGVQILHNIRRLNRNGITSIFLSGAVFDGLDLRGDGEPWATKSNVDLSGAYAPGASFIESILTGISLSETNLQQCNFTGACCGSVDFSGALLLGADFTNAHLARANFTNAHHLKASQLAKARNLHAAALSDRLKVEVLELNPAIFDPEPFKSHIADFFELLDHQELAEESVRARRGARTSHGRASDT